MGLLLLDIAEVTLQGALGAMSDGRTVDVDIGRATAHTGWPAARCAC